MICLSKFTLTLDSSHQCMAPYGHIFALSKEIMASRIITLTTNLIKIHFWDIGWVEPRGSALFFYPKFSSRL